MADNNFYVAPAVETGSGIDRDSDRFKKIQQVAARLAIGGTVIEVTAMSSGIINNTQRVETDKGETYFFQIIHEVFGTPENLMDKNLDPVTKFMRAKAAEYGDPDRQVIRYARTPEGTSWVKVQGDGGVESWRASYGIPGTYAPDEIHDEREAQEVGRTFGQFAGLIEGYEGDLHEVLPDFHNTPKRFDNLQNAYNCGIQYGIQKRGGEDIEEQKGRELFQERLGKAGAMYNEMRGYEEFTHTIVDMLESGAIPTRVIHGDTKCSNALLDENTGKAVAAIDVDTVMVGTILYDIGDGLRSGCKTGGEFDNSDDACKVDTDKFRGWVKGYMIGIRERGGKLTPEEINHIVTGYKMMTLEVAMRFNTDYLDGDNYFKLKPGENPDTNLTRAEAQFKYFKNICAIERELQQIAMDAWREVSESA